MANNYVCEGKTLNYINSEDTEIASSSVVVIGDTVGIAVAAIPAGQVGAVSIQGVYALPKATATAMEQGKNVFWDTANKLVVAAEGENIIPLGRVWDAPGSATTVRVKINA